MCVYDNLNSFLAFNSTLPINIYHFICYAFYHFLLYIYVFHCLKAYKNYNCLCIYLFRQVRKCGGKCAKWIHSPWTPCNLAECISRHTGRSIVMGHPVI